MEIPSGEATEADIDAQIDEFRDRFATLEPVTDRRCAETDFVLISFVGRSTARSTRATRSTSTSTRWARASCPRSSRTRSSAVEPGQNVEAEFVIPESSGNVEFVGKTANFDIEVHEIQGKVLPEVDDELATNAGFETSMRCVRPSARKPTRPRRFARARALEDGVRLALAERLEGEIPEAMVESTRGHVPRLHANLESNDTNLQEYMQQTGTTSLRSRRSSGHGPRVCCAGAGA